jgi:hypothetical protein
MDLKVTDPSGNVYWGNKGLKKNMWSTSGGKANTIDTVENVQVLNPAAGIWLVEVIASEINQDTHVETGATDADYALVVSGVDMGGGGLGTNYCGPANTNSSGQSAVISATGFTIVAANNLTLTVSQLPLNQFGYFLNSDTQGFIPFPGGSQGNLCLGGFIGRHTKQLGNSGSSGVLSIAVDLANLPRPSGPYQVLAGETWNFTCWFRDKNPTATSNFSDGISITFQ